MNQLDISAYFKDIKSSLNEARTMFLAHSFEAVRSTEDAYLVLDFIEKAYNRFQELLETYPSLNIFIDKDFGPISGWLDREYLLELCLVDEFLVGEKSQYPFNVASDQLGELLNGYVVSIDDWCKLKASEHEKTSLAIKSESFDVETKMGDFPCQCNQCTSEYRGKVRDLIFNEQIKIINNAEEELYDLILTKKIHDISNHVQKIRGQIEKNLLKVRYKLKRGSLNKLDADIKAHFKSKFSYKTPLGLVYKEKLMAFFNGLLVDMDIKPEMVSEQEYDRFFGQLNIGIWKPANVLKIEFEKVVRSILAFKRKDISATILREYLGQFWVHAEARRKKRKIIYHMGPTNSGKTYNAIEALALATHGCYLAPLRLLASELYDTLSSKGVKTTLLTGEEVIETESATHYSSTIEMAKLHEEFDCVVIDEIQMITDPQRGWAWTRALVNINANEVHLCGDGSVIELVQKILKLTGDELEVRTYERKTSLSVMNRYLKLSELERSDALIVFSRRNALKYKMDLENLGFKVSIVYGRLSPEVRREQARKFDEGETDVIVATDAISMGMNLPIKRIVFSTITKYVNSKEVPITISELKQIAGRAGRYLRFPKGEVGCLQKVEGGLEAAQEALDTVLDQKELAMVGPDLEIYKSVNFALKENNLSTLSLSEFLRLFNTMIFEAPFYCVDLTEMIELAEMVELADNSRRLDESEVFGFTCAPVNLGLIEHVQYYVWILNHYVAGTAITNELIDAESEDIDYLETAIKCVELYQWLARHFDGKNFSFDQAALMNNKGQAIERLNQMLSVKISKKCSSCGAKLADNFRFNICEGCFGDKRTRRTRQWDAPKGEKKDEASSGRFQNKSFTPGTAAKKFANKDKPPGKSFKKARGNSHKKSAKPPSRKRF